jgi:hypothetical protein
MVHNGPVWSGRLILRIYIQYEHVILALCRTERSFDHIPGRLDLCIGMPVML